MKIYIVTGITHEPYEGSEEWQVHAYTDHRRAHAHKQRANKFVRDRGISLDADHNARKYASKPRSDKDYPTNPHDPFMTIYGGGVEYNVYPVELD